jgi:hypothetical protein
MAGGVFPCVPSRLSLLVSFMVLHAFSSTILINVI